MCERPVEEQVDRVLAAFGAADARSAFPGPAREPAGGAGNAPAAGLPGSPARQPEDRNLRAVLLREKDLPEGEYYQILCKVKTLCNEAGVTPVAHTYVRSALRAGVDAIHLPMPVLRTTPQDQLTQFSTVGASVHSVEEALEAVELGATVLTASHIFPTDCKKDLPPRGLDFLSEVCGAVSVPVYALGGISFENASSCEAAGAAGVCMMSGLMSV